MTKAKPAKKVIVLRPETDTAAHAIASIGKIEAACATSATFKASPTIQGALTAVSGQKTSLVSNVAQQEALRAQLLVLEQQEAGVLVDLDASVGTLCTDVQAVSQNDASIAVGMGLLVKADRLVVAEVQVPSGLRVARLKSGADRIEFNESAGAHMHAVELSVDPPTATSWSALYGNGLKRDFPPLIPGQHYAIRVRAFATDGTPTDWSPSVQYTAPTV